MLNIGPQELLLILLVALLVVGPKRLPELSRTIGKGLREFRKAQDEVTKTIRLGLDDAEPTTRKPSGVPSGTAAGGGPQDAAEGPAKTEPAEDESVDIARSLGRGLSEIRRARREVQRTFRVDLTGRSRRPAPRRDPARGGAAPAVTPQETPRPSPPQPSGHEVPSEDRPPTPSTAPAGSPEPPAQTQAEPPEADLDGPVDPSTPA